jgi:hypothetical protein
VRIEFSRFAAFCRFSSGADRWGQPAGREYFQKIIRLCLR